MHRFFAAVTELNHEEIAACYDEEAIFEDIAFSLVGRDRIHDMWRMIATSDLRVIYSIERAGAGEGKARWTAKYTYRDKPEDPGRPVQNHVQSTFSIRGGRIVRQTDECNALRWGVQALGLFRGVLSWLLPGIRRRAAIRKLNHFTASMPGSD